MAVLELKGALHASQAALDQAFGYARDLRAYHAACAGRTVTPVLLVRAALRKLKSVTGCMWWHQKVWTHCSTAYQSPPRHVLGVEEFLAPDAYCSTTHDCPSSARVVSPPRAADDQTRTSSDRSSAAVHLVGCQRSSKDQVSPPVLLSGVPGSGKTLVGLQLVHAHWLDDLSVPRANGRAASPAVYLSGNGPLVQVLQDALSDAGGGGRTFVQAIKEYVRQHSRTGRPVPPEHLIVFDEAQRAHDAERVAHVHKSAVDKSEPEHLIEFCERIPEWCVLVALIGDGQAIHVGEEAGIELWHQALRRSTRSAEWTVHGASGFSEVFSGLQGKASWNKVLNLDTELRFHLTPKVHQFVAGLLDCSATASLRSLANELHEGGHRFLVTRELEAARSYLRERYADAQYSRYGLIASSKDKWLPGYGVDNTFQTTKQLRVGPWYNADPADPRSCCQLQTVATEFASQGLELDCALLAWGSDLVWQGDRWSIQFGGTNRPPLRDPLTVRKNVYRVLMTRGRDGTVIYVPPASRAGRDLRATPGSWGSSALDGLSHPE